MKQITKTLAFLAFLAVTSAQAEVDLTENLKLRGYIDSSYRSIEDADSEDTLGVDNLDVDFLFGFDKVSSEVHLAESGGDITLEQAFISYGLSDEVTVTFGKYLSLLGYEGDEPYKLYQDTMAYKWDRSGGGLTNKTPFAAYQQGLKVNYSSGNVSATISVLDSVYGGADGDAEDVGIEAQVKYTGIENLTIQLGIANEGDDTAGIDDYLNVWVEYTGIEKTIIGVEYNDYDMGTTAEGNSQMAMVNYAISDTVSLTLRYSEVDETSYELDKFTVSPSYSFSDNLLGRLEFSSGEDNGVDVDFLSIGALFTF